MKPSIGRIVHFVAEMDAPASAHYAAVVTHVWSETCVNLFVFPKGSSNDGADSGVKTSVTFNDPEAGKPYTWHWPEREA